MTWDELASEIANLSPAERAKTAKVFVGGQIALPVTEIKVFTGNQINGDGPVMLVRPQN